MDKERFTLLLLEPNEIYFEDFSVNSIDENEAPTSSPTLSPSTSGQKESSPFSVPHQTLHGRLKMCSKSIVFDPKDVHEPIIKICYKDCDKLYHWPGNIHIKEHNVLAISCSQHIKMLGKNRLTPYQFVAEKRTFLFNMHYAKVDQYLNQMCQLHRASSLHAFEQNDMIAAIVFSRYNRLKFDPLWLNDIYERIIVDYTVEEINPLITNPGRLLLSSKGIYFQPYNNIQPYPVKKIPLKTIKNLIKRRFLLRHTSLEIKWSEISCGTTSEHILYVSFRNVAERDTFYSKVFDQEHLCITEPEPESMTLKWQNGIISNYDYLLYLNSLADRTFQDLTQYPIFPWVIRDYSSKELNLDNPNCYRDLTKPIGALNPERLARLKERCEEMGDPKFLYGSHYSAPGLVLFYLVRKYPKLMLCLQNGRFDHPDRMFNRVEDAFNNCLNNMSDFKELIPEFYDTTNEGDFLLNHMKINFGIKHDGIAVSHVILPLWAEGSPKTFISKLRAALESDYVSRNLNHWIDLIFGYKQRGDEALKADNLFYYLCYEGSVDLDKVNDLAGRHALEVQISEFGQIPKQLFNKPHVPKIVPTQVCEKLHEVEVNAMKVRSLSERDKSNCDISKLVLYDSILSHKDVITCVLIDNNNIISTGKDGLLKCYSIAAKKQTRSLAIGTLPLSSCLKIPDTNTVVLGSWDNTIMTYDLDYGRISNVIPAHDDAVSCLSMLDNLSVVISGSWDCSVKIWKGFDRSGSQSYRMSDSMLAYLSLEEKISSVHSACVGKTIQIVIGTFSGDVHLWTLRIPEIEQIKHLDTIEQKLLTKHTNEITAVSFNLSRTKVVSCCVDGLLHVCDIATGMTLFKKQYNQPLICVNWTDSDELLFLGDECGSLYVWNMQTGTLQLQWTVFDGVVSSIAASTSSGGDIRYVIVGGVDKRDFSIKIFDLV